MYAELPEKQNSICIAGSSGAHVNLKASTEVYQELAPHIDLSHASPEGNLTLDHRIDSSPTVIPSHVNTIHSETSHANYAPHIFIPGATPTSHFRAPYTTYDNIHGVQVDKFTDTRDVYDNFGGEISSSPPPPLTTTTTTTNNNEGFKTNVSSLDGSGSMDTKIVNERGHGERRDLIGSRRRGNLRGRGVRRGLRGGTRGSLRGTRSLMNHGGRGKQNMFSSTSRPDIFTSIVNNESEQQRSTSAPSEFRPPEDIMKSQKPTISVTTILESMDLGKWAEKFESEEIGYETLLMLGDSDLKEMGLPTGPRKKIINKIKQLQREQPILYSPEHDKNASLSTDDTVQYSTVESNTAYVTPSFYVNTNTFGDKYIDNNGEMVQYPGALYGMHPYGGGTIPYGMASSSESIPGGYGVLPPCGAGRGGMSYPAQMYNQEQFYGRENISRSTTPHMFREGESVHYPNPEEHIQLAASAPMASYPGGGGGVGVGGGIDTDNPSPSSSSMIDGLIEKAPAALRSKAIDFNEIILEKKIGEGHFGVVWKANYRHSTVVVKMLINQNTTPDSLKEFFSESGLIVNLARHPNVVECLGVCLNPPNLCMVTEYLELGDLLHLVRREYIPMKDKLRLSMGVAAGMSHLHKEKILHCDLAARNILVTKKSGHYDVKVADFGLSKQGSDYYDLDRAFGPLKWMSPESINPKIKQLSKKSDVWAFGIVMFEILTDGEEPFGDMTPQKAGMTILMGGHPPIPACPAPVREIMLQCFQMNPKLRPVFDRIYAVLHTVYKQYEDDVTPIVEGDASVSYGEVDLLNSGNPYAETPSSSKEKLRSAGKPKKSSRSRREKKKESSSWKAPIPPLVGEICCTKKQCKALIKYFPDKNPSQLISAISCSTVFKRKVYIGKIFITKVDVNFLSKNNKIRISIPLKKMSRVTPALFGKEKGGKSSSLVCVPATDDITYNQTNAILINTKFSGDFALCKFEKASDRSLAYSLIWHQRKRISKKSRG